MAHGKTLELNALEKPEPEGLCSKCRTPWSTHLKKDGKLLKKFADGEHTITSATTVNGYTLRGAPVGFQGSKQPSLGRPWNKRRKTKVHPLKLERARKMAQQLQGETATELVQKLKTPGVKRG